MKVWFKSVCVLTLVVSMILASICMPVAMAEEADTKNYVDSSEIGLLKKLGIITEESMDYQGKITKGEVAFIVAKLCKAQISESGEESRFVDVNTDYKYYPYIDALEKMGVISGDERGRIRPNEAITYNEACKMFTCILGYKKIEQFVAYIDAARIAGIDEEVNATAKLTRGQVLKMAYNTLHASMLELDRYSTDGSFGIETNGNITAIEWYYDLIPLKGIVDVVYGTNLMYPDDSCEDNQLYIGGQQYAYSGAEKLIGRPVVFYVKGADIRAKVKIPQIQYLHEDELKFEMLTVDASQIENFSSRKFTYYPDDSSSKVKTIEVRPEVDVIYNGVAHPSFSNENFKPETGSVTFIDNNGDRKYDVVIIESVKFMVVNNVISEKQIIYGKYGSGQVGSENAKMRITKRDSLALLTALKEDDVIAVKESLNTSGDKRIDISLLSKDTEGSITSLGKEKIKVGNMEYELAKNCLKEENTTLGNYVAIYTLDGKAVAVLRMDETDWRVGYIVSAGKEDEVFADSKLFVELIDVSKAKKVYEAVTNVRIDGELFKDKELALTHLRSAAANTYTAALYEYAQLVKYKVNQGGMLTHIDTNIFNPFKEAEGSLKLDITPYNSEGTAIIRKHSTTYKALYEKDEESQFTKFVCTDPEQTTNMWVIPKTDRDAEQWFSNSWSSGEYPCEVYNLDPQSLRAGYVVGYKSDIRAVDTNSPFWIVKDIYDELDDDGDVVRRISLVGNGTKESMLAPSLDGETVAVGDIIQIRESTATQTIEYIKKIYSNGSLAASSRILSAGSKTSGYGDLGANTRLAYGTALFNKDGVVTHTTSRPDDISGGLAARENLNNYLILSNTYFYLFDTTTRAPKVEAATVNDIVTAIVNSESPDEVFVYTATGNLRFVYMVRR